MSLPSVLILDDEPEVLNALKRSLHRYFNVITFNDPSKALAFYQQSPTPLVISDMRMPDMKGPEFLAKIVAINPRSKRVVLTGYADTEMAVEAINKGHISMYLNKPWDNNELVSVLQSLTQQLKEENTKINFIKKLKNENIKLIYNQQALTAISTHLLEEHSNSLKKQEKLQLFNDELLLLNANLIAAQTNDNLGHSYRVAQQAKSLAKRLKLSDLATTRIFIAGLFFRMGMQVEPPLKKITVDTQLEQQHQRTKYVQVSAETMAATQMLKSSALIVNHIYEKIDGTGNPDGLKEQEIPLGSRILHLAIYYDSIILGEITGRKVSPADAKVKIKTLIGSTFDEQIYHAFFTMLDTPLRDEQFELPLTTSQLHKGMVLTQNILNDNEQNLLSENTTLTTKHINTLCNYQKGNEQPMIVYVKANSA